MKSIKEKVLLIGYYVLVALAGVFFDFSYFVSTLLFFAVPSIYVTIRRPDFLKPLSIYALAIGIPFVLIVDAIGVYNNAWWETSIFSLRIFNLVPFDTVLWGVLYAYTMPALYEYFFGTRKSILLPKKFWKFEIGLLIALAVFLSTFILHREWFVIPHFYAIFVGIFYVLICIIGLIQRTKEFLQLLKQCFIFSTLLFIGELGALAAHQWGFLGNEYLGMINLGHISFPFEEMIWILIGVPAFLYVYLRLTSISESKQV